MTSMKWLKRTFQIACVTASVIVMLAFVAVQFQQRLLQWRAEQLMADMHRIRLYQSNWTDAQRLMSRWGAWGHYDGSCTAEGCRYSVRLTDASERATHSLRPGRFELLVLNRVYSLYRWLGGRYSIIYLAFVVQDGIILRTYVYVNVQVPPKLLDFEDDGYLLMVGATSQQALRDTEGGGSVRGRDDDLAQHPYYKAGRPDGCSTCKMVGITYSTHTPQEEIEQLTSFDMSCLTRFFPCKLPEDLLPAAKQWHFYHRNEMLGIDQQSKWPPPKTCHIPIWALARDSGTVLVVDAVSISQEKNDESMSAWATLKVITYLKGTQHWPIGSTLKVFPFPGLPSFELAEHLRAGNRYVILPVEGLYGTPWNYGPAKNATNDPRIALVRCGLQEDTPDVRRELEKGFTQNDNLRGPELR